MLKLFLAYRAKEVWLVVENYQNLFLKVWLRRSPLKN